MAQHQRAAFLEMVAVAQDAAVAGHELFEQGLALFQRQAGEIVAVEMEKVEDVEDEAVVAALAEIGLEGGEIRSARAGLNDELAVDQRRAGRKLAERGDDGLAEFLRPVEPAAREELHPPRLDARLQAVAVELDLVQPARAGRRGGGERRQRGRNEIGQLRLARALDGGRIGRLGLRLFLYGLGLRAGGFADAAGLRRPAGRFSGDVLDVASGLHRFRSFLEKIVLVFRHGEFVVAFDQQPVLALLARLAVHAHEMPAAVQLLPVELEFEMALGIGLAGVAERGPRAAIPDDDGAAAIFALGNGALEVAVVQRMILDMHGEALFARHEARAARYRPALQHAVHLEAEVVVEARGVVLLDHEAVAALAALAPFRLGGGAEIPLLPVDVERRHSHPAFRRPAAGLRFAAGFFFVSPALWRSASIRSMTLPSAFGRTGLILRPSIFAFTTSARAAS